MCYNVITGSAPSYLYEQLNLYCPSHSSSDTRMLKLQHCNHKTHGFRTFSCFGPHIGNNLPQDIRHSATLSSFKSKLKTFLYSEYFSYATLSITPISLYSVLLCVCVCVCVCVCARIFCVVTLEPLSTLCVSFFYLFFFTLHIFIADNISILMYIMCVILCLFSALSRRVGTLQISIIIIINYYEVEDQYCMYY